MSAHAAAPRVVCDLLVGFNGTARLGRFAPLLVSLDNRGAGLEAELSAEVSSGSELRGPLFTQTFIQKVSLPRGAARRFSFVIPVSLGTRKLLVRLTAGGEELARREVDLRSLATSDRLIVAVSSELAFDFLGSVEALVAGSLEAVGVARVAYPHVENLPDSWAAYDGVETVVVHDTGLQPLKSSQVTALEQWVFSGGTLIFTGGASALHLAAAGFRGLLPVEISGLSRMDDTEALSEAGGSPVGRLIIAESRLTDGKVLLSEGDTPLLVQKELGQGSIYFMSFDPARPPFDAWPGSRMFWARLIAARKQPVLRDERREAADDPWLKPLLDSQSVAFPSWYASAVFAAVYLLLMLALSYSGTRTRIPGGIRTALLFLVPALASGIGYLVFNSLMFRPGAALMEASRTQAVSEQRFALVTRRIGLFSSTAGGYDVPVGGRTVVVEETSAPAGLAQQAPRGFTLVTGAESVLHGVDMRPFDARVFTVTSIVDFSVGFLVEGSASTLFVTVRNGMPVPLRACFLVSNDLAYSIGDVEPGRKGTWSFDIEEGEPLRSAESREAFMKGTTMAGLWARLFEEVSFEAPMLAGWIEEPDARRKGRVLRLVTVEPR